MPLIFLSEMRFRKRDTPFVSLLITDEVATDAPKAGVINQITETLRTTLGNNPATTHIAIQEVPVTTWGICGLPC